jgi:type IV pilus assembly protein PilM
LKKGIPVDGATFEEAQPVLHAVTENVLLEIQKTFDFFKASASTDHIDRIMLSGGASRVDGFIRWCRSVSTRRLKTLIRSAR